MILKYECTYHNFAEVGYGRFLINVLSFGSSQLCTYAYAVSLHLTWRSTPSGGRGTLRCRRRRRGGRGSGRPAGGRRRGSRGRGPAPAGTPGTGCTPCARRRSPAKITQEQRVVRAVIPFRVRGRHVQPSMTSTLKGRGFHTKR